MKEKIIARLKALFSGVNLSNARLDAIADKLAPKITDETTIDSRLNELNDISPFSEIARYDDWQRSKDAKEKAEKETKEKAEKEAKEKADKDNKDKKPDADEPEWAKNLRLKNEELATKLATFESSRTAEQQNQRLVSVLKEKKVPETFYQMAISGRTFKDDAELDTFAGTLTEAYTKFAQANNIIGLKDQPPPVFGNPGDPAKDVSPDMAQFIKDKKAQAAKV